MEVNMKSILIALITLSFYSAAEASKGCLSEIAEKENQELKTSPYWKAKVDEMMTLLNAEQERGCGNKADGKTSGMDIISDDIEFVGTSGNSMFSQSLGYDKALKCADQKNTLSIRPQYNGFAAGQSQISISSSKGSLRFEANSCSPKQIVANFIPAAKLALKAGCGSKRMDSKEADVQIQTEARSILAGEKAAAPAKAEAAK